MLFLVLRVAAAFIALSLCLSAQQDFNSPLFGRTQAKGERVFPVGCASVWAAALQAFDSNGFDPLNLERESGFARFTWRQGALVAFGGAGKATRAFTRMRSGTFTRITNFEVEHATLLIKDTSKGCAASVRVVYRGYRDEFIGRDYWQRLASNGAMETMILDAIGGQPNGDAFAGAEDAPLVSETQDAPPAATSEEASPASLDITAIPAGAEIWINGQFAGSAPSKKTVPAGPVVVEVIAAGHRTWRRELTVADGDDLTIRAELAEEGAARNMKGGITLTGP